jgi:2-polyprenyl-3-methyl-5-hydroxy-6-metoxy-1,4-benzoquinol methylase
VPWRRKLSARERWETLPPGADRDEYFEALHDFLAEFYLADPTNPYRQSGRSSGAARWEESRRCIADAIDRDGDFMDIGCANGLLLESLKGWAADRGHRIRPHGIDFIAELIELARRRHPETPRDSFEVANAFYWEPRRRYDWVRTEVVYVPESDRVAHVQRLYDLSVAPGGRLILCEYAEPGKPARGAARALKDGGLPVSGESGARRVSIAWVEKPPPEG